METLVLPLSNLQLELLKTFSHQLSDTETAELRQLLAAFFAKRAVQAADKVWVEKKWTDENVDNMLNTR